ncbi:alpha/beta fold hydrolase [Leptothrix sp. BB-4]
MRSPAPDPADVAPAWLLVRGLSRSAAHWGDLPQRLQSALRERVHRDARVVCLDLPGNGTRWRERSPASVPALAADLRRQWQAQAGADAVGALHLLALSMGGMVALEWARRHPDELASLTLVNSSLGGLAPLHWRMRPMAWPTLLRLLAWPASARTCEGALHRLTSRDTGSFEATVTWWTALREAEPVSRLNVLRQLLAAARYRLGAGELRRLRVPLQVLCSDGDALVDPRCSAHLSAATGAPLHRHPDAGHDLPLDAPDWLIERTIQRTIERTIAARSELRSP